MKLSTHIVLGGTASICFYPLLSAELGLFWLASALIDIDHYWDFLHRNGFKDWSIKRMFAYHSVLFNRYLHRPAFLALNLFHTAEFLLFFCLVAVAYDSSVMMVIFWGMLFHLVLDVLHLLKHGAVFKRAFSIVEYFVRKRLMIRQGLFPDSVYQEALVLSEAVRFKPGLLSFLKETNWGDMNDSLRKRLPDSERDLT